MGPQSVAGGGLNSSVGAPSSSVTLSNQNHQANSIPLLGAMRGSSPSPAHSRSPTPHQTPPRLAGSQTPQPHTPNAPSAPPLSLQQNQLGQGPGSNKPLQQQQHLGPSASTTPSHPGLTSSSTLPGGQMPRTPVSGLRLNQKISLFCFVSFFYFVRFEALLCYRNISICSCHRRAHSQQKVRPKLQPPSAVWTLFLSSHSPMPQLLTLTPRWKSNTRMRRKRPMLTAAPKEGSSAITKWRKSL